MQSTAAKALHFCKPKLTRTLSRPLTTLSRSISPSVRHSPRSSMSRSSSPVQVSVQRSVTTSRSTSPQPFPDATKPNPTCITPALAQGEPVVYSFFEETTATWQYIVTDPATNKAVIIDSVLDFSPSSGEISTKTADGLLAFVEDKKLDVIMLLETHCHADHLTAAQYLKQRLGGDVPVGIGRRITSVQDRFGPVYGVPPEALVDVFDKLWEDEEMFRIGSLECRVVHLPGHTPDHIGYICGKTLFVGDVLFYPDVGSARADFPGGSAIDLFASIEKVLSLNDDVKIYAGHDYPPQGGGKPEDRCWSSVSEQRSRNVHLASANLVDKPDLSNTGNSDEEGIMKAFIRWRAKRDKTLGAPRLLHPSLQVNIRAGRLPEPDEQGRRALKIPLRLPKGCDF